MKKYPELPVFSNIIHDTPVGKGSLKKKVVLVTSVQELNEIVYKHSSTKSSAYQVKVAISLLPEQVNARLEQKTNQYLESCGCKEGALTAIVLLILGWLFRLEGGWLFSNVFFDMTIVFLFGAIAGKVLTYIVLRIKLTTQLKKADDFDSQANPTQ
jgi:hypothetical protein